MDTEIYSLLEKQESSTIEDGRKLYKDAYRKIIATKLPGLFEIEPDIATDILINMLETLELLVNPEENFQRIPRLGITGEVLTKIALDTRGIIAIPSPLKEDVSEKYDFLIMGEKVDITTSPLDETFVKKFTNGHPITLFVPSYLFDSTDSTTPLRESCFKDSYGYKLIYEDRFDVDNFLDNTLNINYAALEILKEICDHGEFNQYELTSNQFGDVNPKLISHYEGFLNDLTTELNNPLDNT